jgi:hypothetical protein
MKRMLALAKQNNKDHAQWIQAKKNVIDQSLKSLDSDFEKLLKAP